NLIQRHTEHSCDLERHLQRRRILALLDRDDRLPRHTHPVSQLRLRQLTVNKTQTPDVIRHPRRPRHHSSPPRRAATFTSDPTTADKKNAKYNAFAIQTWCHPNIAISIAPKPPRISNALPARSPANSIARSRSSTSTPDRP